MGWGRRVNVAPEHEQSVLATTRMTSARRKERIIAAENGTMSMGKVTVTMLRVDRSAAYAARYVAKNIVAAGLASKCEVQVSYAIGVAEPVSLYADTHGTGTVDDTRLEAALTNAMPLTPRNIREHLGLNCPIYAPTAAYGHFGRTAGEAGEGTFSWEAVDLADRLAASV